MVNRHFRVAGDLHEDPRGSSKVMKPLAVTELHFLSLFNQIYMGIMISLTGYCLVVNGAPTPLNIVQNLMIVIPILISYVVFYNIRSGLIFLFFHAAAIVGPYFYLPTPVAITHTLIMIPLTIVKMYDAIHPQDRPVSDPGLYYLFFCLGCSWANTAAGGPGFINYVCIFGALECILTSAVSIYYRELSNFIQVNAAHASLPVGQIRRTSRILIGIFLAVVSVVIILLPAGGIAKLTTLMQGFMMLMLVFVLKLLFPNAGTLNGEPLEELEETLPMDFVMIADPEDAVAPWVYQVAYILATIIAVIVIAALIGGILYALYAFLRGFHVLPAHEEVSEYTETSERIAPPSKKRLTAAEKANPNYQVRKLYKRNILHLKKKNQLLRLSNSPTEIENDVRMPSVPDRDTLHRIYEKARYSRDGISMEEADSAFTAAKTLRSRAKD
ncbi:MAG: hypothetical protein J5825_10680 [Lachnospiraceae bacterium]|nr:hypothetical protein [Lachnospiraceae bacterium]